MNPLCKLALISHSPDHLHCTLPQTCPTTLLWTVKPYISHTLLKLWGQTPVSFNRNYASYGSGARILRGYTSQTHGLPPPSIFGSLSESIFGYNLQYANIKYANINGAGMMLEEDMGVGECWRISRGSGHVAINLSEAVFISHITMDHASPSLLSQEETTSAPKSMALWALLPPADNTEYEPNTIRLLKDLDIKNYSKNNLPVSSRLLQLIDFQYDISKQPTRQTFQVPFHVHFSTQTVFLEIKSNEGSRTTCIYWLGIYGVDTI